MVRKFVLLAFLAAPFLAAGCSTSDDTTGGGGGGGDDTFPAGCSADTSVSCSAGTTGYSCTIGADPESDDATRVCSDPDTSGSDDTYCCVESGFTAGSCTPSDDVSGACEPGSYGFTCAAGDTDPSTQDPSIDQCSASTADGDSDDYCCTYAAVATGDDTGDDTDFPSGCSPDATVDSACDGNSTGYSCAAGDNPESADPTVICSQPVADGANDDFCCTTSGFTAGSCTPDDSVSDACADGTYGFTCDAGDTDPSTQDSSLSECSAPADGGDADLYCCTYN